MESKVGKRNIWPQKKSSLALVPQDGFLHEQDDAGKKRGGQKKKKNRGTRGGRLVRGKT